MFLFVPSLSTVLRLNEVPSLLSPLSRSLCQLGLTKGKHNVRLYQRSGVTSLCVFHVPSHIDHSWLAVTLDERSRFCQATFSMRSLLSRGSCNRFNLSGLGITGYNCTIFFLVTLCSAHIKFSPNYLIWMCHFFPARILTDKESNVQLLVPSFLICE